MTRRRSTSVAGSPVFVGTVTTLITIIAVFLAYNANAGLPFVPTYDLRASVPDAAGLIPGNEVRLGGSRVGVIGGVEAVPGPGGRPVARLELVLDKVVQPLREDTTLRVRPRSPLGLKYLELTPGSRGRELEPGALLAVERGRPAVELDEVLSTFDAASRRALRRAVDELGPALAARGADLNAALESAPPLLAHAERVAAELTGPREPLRRLVRGAAATSGELAADRDALVRVLESGERTAGALSRARRELSETVAELPATQDAALATLATANPVLADAAALARDLRRGTPRLREAVERLHVAVRASLPALRATPGLTDRLERLLVALERLAAEPATRSTIDRLLRTVRSAGPTVERIAPFQLVCNYLGLWFRNVPAAISEGDTAGTWFRTLVINIPDEAQPRAEPAPQLHVNPYPKTGQDGECEAGNEGYAPGQAIGEAPGRQPGATEDTSPPPGVRP